MRFQRLADNQGFWSIAPGDDFRVSIPKPTDRDALSYRSGKSTNGGLKINLRKIMDKSAQRYGKAALTRTLNPQSEENAITEEALDRIFNEHQNTIEDKSSIYSTKSRSARRPIKSLANMRGKMANARNKGIFNEPSYAEKRVQALKHS